MVPGRKKKNGRKGKRENASEHGKRQEVMATETRCDVRVSNDVSGGRVT